MWDIPEQHLRNICCAQSKEKITDEGVAILLQLIASNYTHAYLYVCTQCQLHFTVEDGYKKHKLQYHQVEEMLKHFTQIAQRFSKVAKKPF